MIWLSRAAIQYAISLCLEKECQHVGIICSSQAQAKYIYDTVIARCEYGDECWKTRYSKIGSNTIYFENGSSITCAAAFLVLRGHKWHQLIIDEHVPAILFTRFCFPQKFSQNLKERKD